MAGAPSTAAATAVTAAAVFTKSRRETSWSWAIFGNLNSLGIFPDCIKQHPRPIGSLGVVLFHGARVVAPVEFEFVAHAAGQAVQIREQGGERDIHAVQLAHAYFTH